MIFGRVKELEKENEELRRQGIARESVVDVLNESVPDDQTGRQNYMSQIAGFYGGIFKKKLEHMISEQRVFLSRIGLTNEEQTILRSNINCLGLIKEWFESRTNEHLGNIQELRLKHESGEDLDIISGMKDKYLN